MSEKTELFNKFGRAKNLQHHQNGEQQQQEQQQKQKSTIMNTTEERRAPLLETISTLSSALIYSDHSLLSKSSSSSSQSSSVSSSRSNSFISSSSFVVNKDENVVDKFMNINNDDFDSNTQNSCEQQQEEVSSPSLLRSKVRFNVDVQINSLQSVSKNNNKLQDEYNNDIQCNISYLNNSSEISKSSSSSSSSSSSEFFPVIPFDDSSSTNNKNDCIESNIDINRSSSCSSLISIEQQNLNQFSKLSSPTVSYANLPIIQQSEKQQQQQFKSILKDPLCAELRNSYKFYYFNDNNVADNNNSSIDQTSNDVNQPTTSINTKTVISNQSDEINPNTNDLSSSSSSRPSSLIVLNPNQLESEIDQLLYGTGPIKNPDNLSPMNILDMDPVLFVNDNNDNVKKINNKSSNGLTNTTVSTTTNSNSTTNSNLPYQTYIQMIEEKYRQNNSQNNFSINDKSSTSTKSKQKISTNATGKVGQKNTKFISNLPNQNKTVNHYNNIDTFWSSNFITNNSLQNSTLDQWMATLIEECENNNVQSNRDTSNSETIETQGDSLIDRDPIRSENSSPPPPTTTGGKLFRQEELYSMLSDPIKGPSINKLMDQLSKWSWAVIGSDDVLNDLKSYQDQKCNLNDDFGLNSNFRNPNNKNLKSIINSENFSNSKKSFLKFKNHGKDNNNRSSPPNDNASSCSSNTTGSRSKSLAENHIYEEILYECLHLEQQQQQQQVQNSK